jgi:hypothetical protein
LLGSGISSRSVPSDPPDRTTASQALSSSLLREQEDPLVLLRGRGIGKRVVANECVAGSAGAHVHPPASATTSAGSVSARERHEPAATRHCHDDFKSRPGVRFGVSFNLVGVLCSCRPPDANAARPRVGYYAAGCLFCLAASARRLVSVMPSTSRADRNAGLVRLCFGHGFGFFS